MLAEIYIDNRIVASNKKATKETGIVVDLPAIAIRTYLGVVYAKKIRFTDGCNMVQDTKAPRKKGVHMWCTARYESLIIDGVQSDRDWLKTE